MWGVRDFAGGYVIHIVSGLFFLVNGSLLHASAMT
jgi:ammonia channel protein AmtB